MLNAGEAHLSHPTQGLLDALTIRQRLGDTSRLVVAVVGDVRHSRVARSAWQALSTLGLGEFRLVGPRELLPDDDELRGARRCATLAEGLDGADVVMALRLQRERMAEARIPDAESYHREYGITARSLALARAGALVMHPGPMNRGVEISDEIADGPQSVIQQQVANGMSVRMAVLAHLLRRAKEPSRASRGGKADDRPRAPGDDFRRGRRSTRSPGVPGATVRDSAARAALRRGGRTGQLRSSLL